MHNLYSFNYYFNFHQHYTPVERCIDKHLIKVYLSTLTYWVYRWRCALDKIRYLKVSSFPIWLKSHLSVVAPPPFFWYVAAWEIWNKPPLRVTCDWSRWIVAVFIISLYVHDIKSLTNWSCNVVSVHLFMCGNRFHEFIGHIYKLYLFA